MTRRKDRLVMHLTKDKREISAKGGACRITFDEFVRKLAADGIGYDIFRFGDTVYVEVRHREFLFGYGFDPQGELAGGWVHPTQSDWKRAWDCWGEYLRRAGS